MAERVRTMILGAAGRDFHNFNMVYRNDPLSEVVAFTATQIPGIDDRRYPPVLAGPLYPEGIPIVAEADLEALCRARAVQRVVFSYSDVTHETVMHLGSRAIAAGADFVILGPLSTCLRSIRPVIAVSAARTGSGKSPVSRWVAQRAAAQGLKVAVIRHPMPYGDLERQRVQRFASQADMDAAECTAEEREEYESHVAAGAVVFAGVDYRAILEAAEREAALIIWDGGNNDFPFIFPDLHIALLDALRPEQAAHFHPGEAVLRMADVILVNKLDSATPSQLTAAEQIARSLNPAAPLAWGALPIALDDPAAVLGRRVLVVDDGPTITHGGMPYGAGFLAAIAAGAGEIVDPRESAVGPIAALFETYPHIGKVLPAAGYDPLEVAALRETIERSGAEVVVAGTPIDLAALIGTTKPIVRARYSFQEQRGTTLATMVDSVIAAARTGAR
jgi:predicted GTPase